MLPAAMGARLIYEIPVYEAAEGPADAMRRRFADHLTHITRFADEDARQKAWASCAADPERAAVKAFSETDEPLLKNQIVSVLSPAIAGLPLG